MTPHRIISVVVDRARGRVSLPDGTGHDVRLVDAANHTVHLLVDGRAEPGKGRVVGPVPEGGKVSLEFRVVPATLGEHLLSVRLVGDELERYSQPHS